MLLVNQMMGCKDSSGTIINDIHLLKLSFDASQAAAIAANGSGGTACCGLLAVHGSGGALQGPKATSG